MHYIGTELELFAHAENWKRYSLGGLRPYAQGRVLEVGAGHGANTRHLINSGVSEWVCLEPDVDLASSIWQKKKCGELDHRIEVASGTIESLENTPRFDTIFYIDVIEHIEDDRGEIMRATALLNPGGYLAVLAPAHMCLFSTFDRAIGHFRRYTLATLAALTPPNLCLRSVYYLDSAGVIASATNRLLLRAVQPTLSQIHFWDRVLIPFSRWLDPLLLHKVGKTVVAVWQKNEYS